MVMKEAMASRLPRNLKCQDRISSRDVTAQTEKFQSVLILAQVIWNAVKDSELDVARQLWYREVPRLSAESAFQSTDRMNSRDVVVDKERFQSVSILDSQ